jgi:hypothetical protein
MFHESGRRFYVLRMYWSLPTRWLQSECCPSRPGVKTYNLGTESTSESLRVNSSNQGLDMRKLEDEIARLNLRAEQLLIHLQELPSGSPEAIETRRTVEAMVDALTLLKSEQARVLSELRSARQV